MSFSVPCFKGYKLVLIQLHNYAKRIKIDNLPQGIITYKSKIKLNQAHAYLCKARSICRRDRAAAREFRAQ